MCGVEQAAGAPGLDAREKSGEFVRGTTWVFEDGSQVGTCFASVGNRGGWVSGSRVDRGDAHQVFSSCGALRVSWWCDGQVILRADANETSKEDDTSFYDEFERTTRGEEGGREGAEGGGAR